VGQREDEHLIVVEPEEENVWNTFDEGSMESPVAFPDGELLRVRPRSLDLCSDFSDKVCAQALLTRLVPARCLDELHLGR
jgi:hypothetical protein